jgi:hypothetical protein
MLHQELHLAWRHLTATVVELAKLTATTIAPLLFGNQLF